MRRSMFAVCVAAALAWPGVLSAQIDLGPQVNWGDDVDFGVGGRVWLGIPAGIPLAAIGSFDYFFPGNDVTYWEFNANAVYSFPIPSDVVAPYAGAGFNIAHASANSVGNTELGFNILGGAKFTVGQFTPFGELRFELSGGEQFVITGGLLFNVGPGF